MGNEFIIALVIGLILLLSMVIIFNSNIQFKTPTTTSGYRSYADHTPYIDTSNLTGAVLVGNSNETVTKFIDLGNFDIRATRSHVSISKQIFSGLLFGSDSIKITGNVGSLDISVKNTNNYGNLVVKITNNNSDKIIFNQAVGIGQYHIPIEQPGDIEINVESSGWKIWAPTIYDISVESNVYDKAPHASFGFNADADVNTGQLRIFFRENYGKALIKLNNNIIQSSPVASTFSLNLDKKNMWSHNNLTIEADQDAVFAGSSQVQLDYVYEKTGRIELPFYVNATAYKAMQNDLGYITFDIVKIDRQGGIAVKVKYGDQLLFTRYDETNIWNYKYYFGRSDVKEGSNKLIIEATDNALFWVKNVRVCVTKCSAARAYY